MIVVQDTKIVSTSVLELTSINKSYASADQRVEILKDISFTLLPGMSLSIQGPSGCGKSTLLHLIGALDTPDSGSICMQTHKENTIEISALSESAADAYRRKHVGFVFQRFNLIDCISVLDNILLPSQLNKEDAQDYVDHLARTLGIAEHMHKLPTQLSGGQQQRVALARALAHKPQLVLADEPTGNLDEDNADIVADLLYQSCKTAGTSLIVVTHSKKVAEQADTSMRMQHKHLSL